MAPLNTQPLTKVLFLLVLFALLLVPPSSSLKPPIKVVGRRNLLEKDQDQEYLDPQVQPSAKKKQDTTTNALGTTTQSKNKTKLIKPTTPTKTLKLQENSTSKPVNLTKVTKPTSKIATLSSKSSNSTKPTSKTPTLSSKSTNSTKPTSKTPSLSSKSTNHTKPTSKSTNPTSTLTQKSQDPTKKIKQTTNKESTKPVNALTFEKQEEEDDLDDIVSEFKDLPSRFQETLIPDLEVISTTSKTYLNKANKQITKHFNPYVGKKYAPIVASIISFAFILIPFLLVSLIFNQIKAYFSLQKLIIFIQIYLSIYFSILALSSLVTGLEPLKFFYNTSQSTYLCIQLMQTLGYVLYLVLLLMYFVLVFSTESGLVLRLLGLGQMFVGFAVGLHYYMAVFHRAVLRQPPKSSWKVHSVYATCFLVICLLGSLERRKKAYVVDGCEQGKKN